MFHHEAERFVHAKSYLIEDKMSLGDIVKSTQKKVILMRHIATSCTFYCKYTFPKVLYSARTEINFKAGISFSILMKIFLWKRILECLALEVKLDLYLRSASLDSQNSYFSM